ncbi:transcriptional regulator with XRE-family HTH domain [Streptomyces phaeochromogenes]|jgi:transcriptional regulator with XRE-family HTH domain|uniref:peptidoglycan-binding protein n=1 Tax=Streptomyces TaxID=1883 RepID=UPI00117C8202|nr:MULTISPECIES: peptidoglycan-binding protein [Streptomyces]MDQ0954408.1 transcriptional regulator with XRE-family HTH domain [Streptomyces phaeochromogenes]TRO68270.1 peptidoglycan-binding protein [Streptomyces sp. IB201691-2A2]
MSRWKALPGELDPRVRQLVVRLRRLKDHSGLSLRQLSAKTGYSASSWERYLGGRSLPPREAVEAMARIGGDDPTRLLALHEVAAEAWGEGRSGTPAPEAREASEATGAAHTVEASESLQAAGADDTGPYSLSAPNEETRQGRSLRVALVAGSVALVLAVSSAVLLAVRLSDGDGRASATPLASATASASPSPSPSGPRTYACEVERIDGRWYAGNSRTRDAVLAEGLAGPEVAEAQCLLRRAGLAPGVVDGIFGPHTKSAVEQLQKRAGLVVDGIIGRHTWGALRR